MEVNIKKPDVMTMKVIEEYIYNAIRDGWKSWSFHLTLESFEVSKNMVKFRANESGMVHLWQDDLDEVCKKILKFQEK